MIYLNLRPPTGPRRHPNPAIQRRLEQARSKRISRQLGHSFKASHRPAGGGPWGLVLALALVLGGGAFAFYALHQPGPSAPYRQM
jgi:hypothetical protein